MGFVTSRKQAEAEVREQGPRSLKESWDDPERRIRRKMRVRPRTKSAAQSGSSDKTRTEDLTELLSAA